MTANDPLGGDDWADLAEELGVGELKPVAQPVPDLSVVEAYDGSSDGGEESDDLIEADGEEVGSEADGEDGEPRKRKRRRRRRKKKGTDTTGPAAEMTEEEAEASSTDEDDLDEESAEPERGESLEDSSPEAARELIRTWNVPSWDEIIGGLYRPDR